MGRTSYITNLDGDVVQHIEYVPFGEVFLEERNNKWNTPYLFNAKELDEETGLYYYGARYYDPRVGVFYGVDPLVEKTMTPYQYCYNNPVKFIDPTGMIAGDFYDLDGNKIGTDGVNDGKQYIVLDGNQAKQISATNKSGGITDRKNISSSIEKPSSQQIKAGSLAFDFTETEGYECGFVGAQNGGVSKIVTQSKEGSVQLRRAYEDIENVKMNGKSILSSSFDVHTHPKKITPNGDGTFTYAAPYPSGNTMDNPGASGDYGNRKLGEMYGTNIEPSWVLGWDAKNFTPAGTASQTRTVSFYRGSGIVGTVEWSKFVKTVNSIP